MDFALNPMHDAGALASRFRRDRRLQVQDFLVADGAARLRSFLEGNRHWRHLFNQGERIVEVDCAEWDALPETERLKVSAVLEESAAFDFQYRYDTIRVDEQVDGRSAKGPLEQFAAFMSSPAVLDLIGQITGADDLLFADCQATRYRRGDYLTPHNDEVEGQDRRLAYVLGLTPNWLPRWGGLLHFVGEGGGIDSTIVPRFNALSLFEVGQSHFVSEVASFAPLPRISVTGWLRTRRPARVASG